MYNEGLAKMTKKHPITIKLNKLNAKIDKLQAELKEVQNNCPHQWKITGHFNNGDGWSKMTISYFDEMQCEICDLRKTVKTSEGPQYV